MTSECLQNVSQCSTAIWNFKCSNQGFRAVKSNWFWFDFRLTRYKNHSIRFRFDIDSIQKRFDTKTASADMKKIGDFEVDQFYKWIVHHNGKNIWESLLWLCSVNSSFSTITVQGFSCSPFCLARIESYRKFHSIRSAFDSIWAKTFDSIRKYDSIFNSIWQPWL
jgi:hypothetical protein